MNKAIQLPLRQEVVKTLRAGDEVVLCGPVLTGRDVACARLVQTIEQSQPLPVNLDGQVIYLVGPSPAPPGHVIGAAGPTTTGRMNPFLPSLLARGLRGFIGKGYLAEPVKQALIRHQGVYFGAVGGTGALLSASIQEVHVIAFEDLATEAIHQMKLKDFPAVVLNDLHGGDLYAQATATQHGGAPRPDERPI